MAPITDDLKQGEFKWTNIVVKAFREFKERMTKAPIMSLSDFLKVF